MTGNNNNGSVITPKPITEQEMRELVQIPGNAVLSKIDLEVAEMLILFPSNDRPIVLDSYCYLMLPDLSNEPSDTLNDKSSQPDSFDIDYKILDKFLLRQRKLSNMIFCANKYIEHINVDLDVFEEFLSKVRAKLEETRLNFLSSIEVSRVITLEMRKKHPAADCNLLVEGRLEVYNDYFYRLADKYVPHRPTSKKALTGIIDKIKVVRGIVKTLAMAGLVEIDSTGKINLDALLDLLKKYSSK